MKSSSHYNGGGIRSLSADTTDAVTLPSMSQPMLRAYIDLLNLCQRYVPLLYVAEYYAMGQSILGLIPRRTFNRYLQLLSVSPLELRLLAANIVTSHQFIESQNHRQSKTWKREELYRTDGYNILSG